MQRNPVRCQNRSIRKSDGPGQMAFATVATAIHQATNPAKDISQGNAGGDYIRQLPQRDLLQTRIEDTARCGSNQPTVINQPAVPDFEDLHHRMAGELFLPIGHDVKGTSTENGADNQPGPQIQYLFAGNAAQQGPAAGCP